MALAENQKIFPGVNLDQAQEQVRIALRRAFTACGSQAEFARRLRTRMESAGERPVTVQAIAWWVSEGQFIDERYWSHVEILTDMAVTRRHLRPDIYGLGAP
jgi:hypothetical protein